MEENKEHDPFSLQEIKYMITTIIEKDKIESWTDSEKFPSLDEVEQILGYKFKDRGLLEQAFTHGSYKDKLLGSYERLEYYGDSVLNLLIARDHYFSYPNLTSGELTKLRADNVDTEKLARAAVKLNFHKYLRHKTPLLHGQIEEFKEAIEEYPLHSSGLIVAPKVLADIVESTIGAIFQDTNSSLDITWKVWKRLLEPLITPKTLQTRPMTKFSELCQKHGFKFEFVDLWEEKGAIYVFVENEFVGRGIYKAKKLTALNRAANNAYNQLLKNLRVEVENVNLA